MISKKLARKSIRAIKLLPHRAYRRRSLVFTAVLFSLVVFFIASRNIVAFRRPAQTVPAISTRIFPTPVERTPLPHSTGLSLPAVTAKNIFILDRDSKTVLYHQSADDPVPPASTTKIMTALVSLENFPLDQQITVSQEFSEGVNIGLTPGETLSVEQLLYALLVQSANDAAEVLAQNFPGGREAFVAAMNDLAQKLGLSRTQFVNPTGLDEDGHLSSASDLARLADTAMQNPEFARIVSTENAVVSSRVLTNVNELLGQVPGVLGVKTGYTDAAGQALITLVDQGRPVIIVVLKSTDRFGDTKSIISWVYSNFSWITAQ